MKLTHMTMILTIPTVGVATVLYGGIFCSVFVEKLI